MSKWNFFSEEESKGLNDDLMSRLDMARGLCGFPIVITSGKRTDSQNASAGGVSDSSHLLGLAADLHSPTGQFEREKMIWALGRAGFRRIELATKHIHVDVNPNKQQDVAWFGVSN
jgi:uncharacterized protein YcbK (DUF882 family)